MVSVKLAAVTRPESVKPLGGGSWRLEGLALLVHTENSIHRFQPNVTLRYFPIALLAHLSFIFLNVADYKGIRLG